MFRAIRTIWMVVCMVCVSGSAYGGFLIELKGGAEIVVNDYWEVEGEIRYSRYGGFIGLPAEEIKDIRPTDRPVGQREQSSRASGIVPSAASPVASEAQPGNQDEPGTPEAREGGPPVDSEEFRQRADQFRFELSMNIRDSRREIDNIEDARRANDGEAEQAAMARLKVLVEEQGKLTSEIEQLYEGSLPPWWFQIMDGR